MNKDYIAFQTTFKFPSLDTSTRIGYNTKDYLSMKALSIYESIKHVELQVDELDKKRWWRC